MASLENRRGHWLQARRFAQQALSIDTYDPAANYQFGIASLALTNSADAQDAFSLAALSPGWRSAACVELSKAFLREQRYDRALANAEESLDYDRRNLDGLELTACIQRLQENFEKAQVTLNELLKLDPLNHFARFEKYLLDKARRQDFIGMIRNELPHETYLELAAWYRGVGRGQDAVKVLELAPPTTEVIYWLAYLRQDTNLLARAVGTSPVLVFPFRTEAIPVFEWADKASRNRNAVRDHSTSSRISARREFITLPPRTWRTSRISRCRASIRRRSARRAGTPIQGSSIWLQPGSRWRLAGKHRVSLLTTQRAHNCSKAIPILIWRRRRNWIQTNGVTA